eukprot:TRINITY_DN14435_c0_g1_i1.p2 TRINITY_DN14435_c0_g1~~TRINITY_DN14435_c0_g1_i1.p2  ORF type:complete len:176 (-),score=12.26 TRINITY_DN14435_c0_g1_i1:13-540(-)
MESSQALPHGLETRPPPAPRFVASLPSAAELGGEYHYRDYELRPASPEPGGSGGPGTGYRYEFKAADRKSLELQGIREVCVKEEHIDFSHAARQSVHTYNYLVGVGARERFQRRNAPILAPLAMNVTVHVTMPFLPGRTLAEDIAKEEWREHVSTRQKNPVEYTNLFWATVQDVG